MTAVWIGDPAGMRIESIVVSFQRFERPPDGRLRRAPASLGALPPSKAAGGYCLPLGDEEAFWVGIFGPPPPPDALTIIVTDTSGHAVSLDCALQTERGVLPGRPRLDGTFDALCPPFCVEIGLLWRCREAVSPARILVVSPRRYEILTGTAPPAPLDTNAAYKGWRLP